MEKIDEAVPFTVLENKTIGRNISMYRKIRDIKALDVAERLGMKEATYTKYERGETAITINFIQQVAEILKIDPITLLSVHPSIFIEVGQSIGNNSPVGIHGNYNHQTANEEQVTIMLKLIEKVMLISDNVMEISNKLITLMSKNDKAL